MATTPNAVTPADLSWSPRALLRRMRGADEIAHLITLVAAATLLLITVLLVYQLWVLSAEARHKFGWSFFVTKTWDPVAGDFGALPFIYGTLLTSVVALALAVPLGVGGAIFLAELAPPKLSSSLTFVSDLLAAVPSVIYGLLGVFLLVPIMRTTVQPALKKTLGFLPLFQGPAYGIGFLTAGIVLAIMIVPFVLSVSPKSCWRWRATKEKQPWRWARRNGNPPGKWSCPQRGSASSDRCFWRWRARWVRRWPLPWSSATIPRLQHLYFRPGIRSR